MADLARPDKCPHEQQEPRQRVFSDGRTHVVMQCLDCGAQTKMVERGRTDLREAALRNPPFDPTIREQALRRSREAWDEQQARNRQERQAKYEAYLSSDAWQRRRLRRLTLDQYRCQAMLSVCTVRATEVHHLTYDHIFNEPMFDLISVCGACHRQITLMDRGELTDRLSA